MASLNDDGQRVMRAIRGAGLAGYYVNLMVMDYGEAMPRNCVVTAGRCDMGRSSIQAARNFNATYGVPFGRIELTPMIGVNDVTANVFTLTDAAALARFVRDNGLAGGALLVARSRCAVPATPRSYRRRAAAWPACRRSRSRMRFATALRDEPGQRCNWLTRKAFTCLARSGEMSPSTPRTCSGMCSDVVASALKT